jgi:orotate phosphoribosyltransferase
MTLSELAAAVVAHQPFVQARRGDGTLLPNYFDGHRILAAPQLLAPIAEELWRRIAQSDADLVAGEVVAGSQLASAVALASVRTDRPLASCGIRRAPKEYGVGGRLTGYAPPRSRVAVVDDVAGTGAAARRCIEVLRDAGHHVSGVYVLLDRRQGASELISAAGCTLDSLFELRDLQAFCSASPDETP